MTESLDNELTLFSVMPRSMELSVRQNQVQLASLQEIHALSSMLKQGTPALVTRVHRWEWTHHPVQTLQ